MKLTQAQRSALYAMFEGKCAYCGHDLPEKGWHADHVEPIDRIWYGPRKGELSRPENDTFDNLFPACQPCNTDKHVMSLETWRGCLAEHVEVCRRNHSAFRHAERFGQVVEVKGPIVFWFEKVRAGLAVPA